MLILHCSLRSWTQSTQVRIATVTGTVAVSHPGFNLKLLTLLASGSIVLRARLAVLYIVLQTMGFRYHPVTEIRLREQRLVEWQATIPSFDSARYAIPTLEFNPSRIPVPSSLDQFGDRQQLRREVAKTIPRSNVKVRQTQVFTRPMCRQGSIGRPDDENLNIQRPDWQVGQQRWLERELTPFLQDLRRWRTDYLQEIQQIQQKAKCAIDPQPGLCDDA